MTERSGAPAPDLEADKLQYYLERSSVDLAQLGRSGYGGDAYRQLAVYVGNGIVIGVSAGQIGACGKVTLPTTVILW